MTESLYFDFTQLFDADEYLYFMEESLRDENTSAQVDFIEQAMSLGPPGSGKKVVDLGCGHGRHALELGARGYTVTGIDLIEGFLEVARKGAQERGLNNVEFVRGDIGAFNGNGEYDAALCLFDAFGFFEDAHCIGTLRSAHASLAMGGKFMLDLRTREWMTRVPPVSVLDKGNGDMMIDRHQFDITTGRFVDRRTYVRDGRQREVMFSVRLFAFTEIRLILSSVGFDVEGVFGGFDGSPLSANKPRTVIVCTKVETPTVSTA